MVERWTVAPVVAGSNPVTHPGARSSTGESAGLRTRRLRVRVAPGAFAPLAQLAEQRILNPWVAGSTPARGIR